MNNTYKTSEAERARDKSYYEANKEKIKAQMKVYYEANKEKIKARKKAYREANREKMKAQRKAEYEANREAILASMKVYNKAKYACDIPFKLCSMVKNGSKRVTGRRATNQEAIDFLGCTLEEYKEYLESKFQQGMTWDNHTVDGWHIDHILPLNESGTTLTEEEKLKRLHYTNTQPLWATDNIKKGNKRSGKE